MQAAESDSLSEELNICAPTHDNGNSNNNNDDDDHHDDAVNLALQNPQTDPASSVSPTSLRRSSRVSALRAQKKESDYHIPGSMVENHEEATTAEGVVDTQREHVADHEAVLNNDDVNSHVVEATDGIAEIAVSKKKLKRKLADTQELDQYDSKFGIRLDSAGDVVVMTDGSEISSLDTQNVKRLREECDSAMKQEVSDEVLAQREVQIRELEAALRLEEAKLSMLKKIRQNQQQNYHREQPHKRLSSAGIAQNSSGGNAYRPVVASGASGALNQNASNKMNGVHGYAGKGGSKPSAASAPAGGGNSTAANASNSVAAALASGTLSPQHQQLLQSLLAKVNNNPQQFAQLIRQLTPAHITTLLQQQQQQQAAAQQHAAAQQQQQQVAAAAAAAAAAKSAAAQAAKSKEVVQNNVQKIAAARQQLRHHLEQQLLQLPTPKTPLSELPFLPNANQPDFCALLGLDLTVQRVLKDKSVFRRAEFPPYVCEECGTDFTPAWKAIAGEEENYHLYCEECVKEAQKRKVRQDYMSLLKRAFAKVQEQEKEFERQATAGKFSDPVPTVPAVTVANHQYNPSPATNATAGTAQRNVPSPLASSTPSKSTSAGSAAVSTAATVGSQSGSGSTKQTGVGSGQRANKKRVSNNGSVSGGSTSSPANAAANLLNSSGLGNSPQMQQRLMAQWMMSQMGTNPLMATMFQNPMLLQQFWQLMTSQRLPQGAGLNSGGGGSGNNSNSNSQMPIAAALLAAAQSAQQQQNSSSSGGAALKSSSSNTANSSSGGGGGDGSGINPMLLAQLRQLSSSGGLMNNPQLMHAFQQAQLAQQMRDYASSSSKVKGGSGKK